MSRPRSDPWRVVVTPRSLDLTEYGLDSLLAENGCETIRVPGPLTSEQLAQAWAEADAAILGLDDADASAIRTARRLRVIARYGVGYDRVDVTAATRAGIAVTVTRGALETSVAELAVALMFAAARRFDVALTSRPPETRPPFGRELQGATAGVIGMGQIGRAVALRAAALGMHAAALGMHVVYSARDRRSRESPPGARNVELPELLSLSDVISLHCPLTDATRQLIGRAELERMKPDAILVNTARAELVDEEALVERLRLGLLGAAALDVTRRSDGSRGPLDGAPRVLLTPHIGSHTREARMRMARAAVESVIAIKDGVTTRGLLNPGAELGAATAARRGP